MTRSNTPISNQPARPTPTSLGSARPRLIIKAGTHAGKVRDHNEDYFLTPDLAQIPADARQKRGELVIVADGMGGHAAGEVAARMSAENIMRSYYTSRADPKSALLDAIRQANAEVFHAQQHNAAQEGMGSTVVAAVFLPDRVVMASVGDSRIYRVRGGRIEQLTQDHTWVNEKLRSREITADEAVSHPYRSVITRAMGASLDIQSDAREEDLRLGDVYVLCSDGLSNMVTGEEMRQVLASTGPQPAITKLIHLANSRGGPDNITAAVVSFGVAESATVVGIGGRAVTRPVLFGAIGGAVGLLLLVVLLLNIKILPPVEPTVAPGPQTATAAAVNQTATPPVVVVFPTTPSPSPRPETTTVANAATVAASAPLSTASTTAPTATLRPAAPTSMPVRATPTPLAQPLAAPVIAAPDDGFTADQGFVRFMWQAVVGAGGYRVETRSDRLEQKEWREWPAGAALEMTLNFEADDTRDYFSIPGTEYFWRVAALDAQGRPRAYSVERKFEFNRPQPTDTPAPPPSPSPSSGAAGS